MEERTMETTKHTPEPLEHQEIPINAANPTDPEEIEQFQEFSRIQEAVGLAMPLNENTTQMLNQLDAIARTSGVKMVSFESAPTAFEESARPLTLRLGSLEINMNVTGNYENLKEFLRFLETNVRVFNVQRYVFSPESESGKYQLFMKVETYFQE